jgi:hypothetical protein
MITRRSLFSDFTVALASLFGAFGLLPGARVADARRRHHLD